ncbi:MAG: 2-oxoacid:ferredoxin oxidoreductase subunit beta [Deltaproteobacteria bacterium]|nr:2-oxoacid:ferredoxin oxidoreductase subunit beta [Deltaproteobacteria bacterium]
MSECKSFNICSVNETAWCPGCGDLGILAAVKDALEALGKSPHEVLMMAGIGQAAKLPQYITANGYCGLHGRALPAATGAKLANEEMTILLNSGDGDMYGEGGGHFLHTLRRDIDVTLMVHNNQIYGLTQGQASPTSDIGLQTKLQPRGVISYPLRGPALALALGCRFVARSFSGDLKHLSALIQKGVKHRGLSYIEILQPCISMNKVNTFKWYKDRIFDVNANPNYDTSNRIKAMEVAMTWGDQIPTGLLFHDESGDAFHDRIPQLKQDPLVRQPAISHNTMNQLFAKHM